MIVWMQDRDGVVQKRHINSKNFDAMTMIVVQDDNGWGINDVRQRKD
jgi:hypothetical protein